MPVDKKPEAKKAPVKKTQPKRVAAAKKAAETRAANKAKRQAEQMPPVIVESTPVAADDSANLALWRQVDTTPLEFCEPVEYGGRTFTSVKAMYIVRLATEVWGPWGEGWGYDILEDRLEQGGPILMDGNAVGHEVTRTIKVQVWHLDPETGDKISLPPHYGDSPHVYVAGHQRSKYIKTDHESAKKALTSAIKKALSLKGFAADVYLGKFDQEEYVAAQEVRQRIEQADDKNVAIVEERAAFHARVAYHQELLGKIPNVPTLGNMYKRALSDLEQRSHVLELPEDKRKQLMQDARTQVDDAYRKRLDILRPPVDLACTECGTISTGQPGDKCPECKSTTQPME